MQAVHQHTNGLYTHSEVTMWFGTHSVSVSLRGKEHAERWAGSVLGSRNRVMQLMLEGYLEAEQGVDLIPPALLTRAPRGHPPIRDAPLVRGHGPRPRWSCGAASRWRTSAPRTRRSGGRRCGPAPSRAYGPYASSGRHAGAARQEIARLHERARAGLRTASDPRAAGAEALRGALAILETKVVRRVPAIVEIDGKVEAGQRATELAADLGQVLAAVGLAPVMELVPATTAGDAPVALGMSADLHEAGKLACTARLTVAGSTVPLFTWSLALEPEKAPGDDAHPARRLRVEARRSLGLGGAATMVQSRAPHVAPPSPYAAGKP